MSNITEKTKVNVGLATFWSLIVSIIGTTVWITHLILGLQYRVEELYVNNQREHQELTKQIVMSIDDHHSFVRKENLEALLITMHRKLSTNVFDPAEELSFRQYIRDGLSVK